MDGVTSCFGTDCLPQVFAARAKALAEKRAKLVAELRAQLGG